MKKKIIFAICILVLSAGIIYAKTDFDYFDRGVELFKKGDLKSAVEQFNLAIDKNPNEDIYHNWIASVYYDLKEYDNAISHLNKAVELKDVWYYYLVMSHVKNGQTDKAYDVLPKAISVESDSVKKKAMEELLVKIKPYMDHFTLAGKYLENKEYKKAKIEIETALSYVETPAADEKLLEINRAIEYRNKIYIGLLILLVILALIGYYIVRVLRWKKLVEKTEENIGDVELAATLFGRYMEAMYLLPHEITAFKPETILKIYKHRNIVNRIIELPLSYRESIFNQLIKDKDFAEAYNVFKICHDNVFNPLFVVEMYEKLDKMNDLYNIDMSLDSRVIYAKLLFDKGKYSSAYLMIADQISEIYIQEEELILVSEIYEKNGNLDDLLDFIQSIPQNKRTAYDWDLLISIYDKLDELSALSPSCLPDNTYRRKVIQIFEKKQNYSGIMDYVLSIPLNERLASDWELLISSCAMLGKLSTLDPSELRDNYHQKVIQLFEENQDNSGIISFLSKIPETKWTVETYQLWFESCAKNGMLDNAVKSLLFIQKRDDSSTIFSYYYGKAMLMENEGQTGDAITIYRKFVNENIFFKDILERYIKLSGGEGAIKSSRHKRNDRETIVSNVNQEELINSKYEILREIGRGGMGIVYEAINRKIDKQVAIKKMKEELSVSPREKKKFLEEAKRVAELHHPNIVEIYDMYEEGNDIYLVFEYVNGCTVDSLLDQREQFKLKETLDISLAVCSALEYAHGKKMIHRDIKPSNIMVSKEKYIKVMDFGIARVAKDTFSRLTGKDTSGTLAYMSPEQELGTYSEQADIYSLGITMYEMLTGDVPFKGPNYLAQKRELAYRPLSELAPDIPANIDQIINKCLQADKEKRYRSISELAFDMNKI